MPDHPSSRLPRRAVLGTAAAALLGACGAAPPPGPTPPRPAAGEGTASVDEDLAAEGAELAAGLEALVAAATRAHPGLRPDLAGLRAAHRTHADVLAPDPTADPAPVTDVPARRAAALARVVRRERDAVTAYADLAARAEGGRLARVLAAAAGGLAQHLAVLEPGGPPVAELPTTLPGSGASPSGLQALQTTLAAEHAAVATLAVVGARTSAVDSPALLDDVELAYGTHRDRRDALAAAVRDAGDDPVAAAPAYEPPDLGSGTDGRRRATRRVEEACAATYAYLVAGNTDERRSWATGALLDAAVRSVVLGGAPQDLPGT